MHAQRSGRGRIRVPTPTTGSSTPQQCPAAGPQGWAWTAAPWTRNERQVSHSESNANACKTGHISVCWFFLGSSESPATRCCQDSSGPDTCLPGITPHKQASCHRTGTPWDGHRYSFLQPGLRLSTNLATHHAPGTAPAATPWRPARQCPNLKTGSLSPAHVTCQHTHVLLYERLYWQPHALCTCRPHTDQQHTYFKRTHLHKPAVGLLSVRR